MSELCTYPAPHGEHPYTRGRAQRYCQGATPAADAARLRAWRARRIELARELAALSGLIDRTEADLRDRGLL